MAIARGRVVANAVKVDGESLVIMPNAEVTIYEKGTTTPYAQPIYAGVTGSTELGNPFNTDAYGNILFYIDGPKRLKIKADDGAGGICILDYEPALHDPEDLVDLDGGVTLPGMVFTNPTIDGGSATDFNLQGGVITDATFVNPIGIGVDLSGYVTITGTQTITGHKTLSQVTIPGHVYQGKRHHWDVREFGAVADGVQGGGGGAYFIGTDNSVAFQNAINAAAGSAYGADSSECYKVYIPGAPLKWMVGSATANPNYSLSAGAITDYLEIYGDGPLSNVIPLPNCVGKDVLDIVGSSLELRNFMIGTAAFDDTNKPRSIIRYGVGAGSGNACRFERIALYGLTTVATFDNGDSGVSSVFENCFIFTYGASAPCIKMSAATDITFIHCEIHEVESFWLDPNPTGGYTGVSNSNAIKLINCQDIKFYGSNIGGNGPAAVRLEGTNINIILDGIEIYAQDPMGIPWNHIIHNAGTVIGLHMRGCALYFGSFALGGETGAIFKKCFVHSMLSPTVSPVPSYFIIGNALVFEDCDIDCIGLAADLNSGGSGTATRSRFWNVSGTLTANTKTGVMWQDTAGKFYIEGVALQLNELELATRASGTTAAANTRRLYSKTVSSQGNDGHVFFKDSAGNEKEMMAHPVGGMLGAQVRRAGSSQTVVSGWNTLVFDTEVWDNDPQGVANLGTNADRLTIKTAGTYVFTASAEIGNVGASLYGLRILFNSSVVVGQLFYDSNNVCAITVTSHPWKAAAGQIVQAEFYKSIGGSHGLNNNDYSLRFSAVRIGPG